MLPRRPEGNIPPRSQLPQGKGTSWERKPRGLPAARTHARQCHQIGGGGGMAIIFAAVLIDAMLLTGLLLIADAICDWLTLR